MARYGLLAQDRVEKTINEMKEGKLKSGQSGKKAVSPKQAAVGLSEARKRKAKDLYAED